MLADHARQIGCLPFEAQAHSLEFLIVLEFGLEQAYHLHGEAGSTRDGNRREPICLEDLLNAPVRYQMPLGRLPVADHHHSVGESECENRGSFWDLHAGRGRALTPFGKQIERTQKIREAGPRRRCAPWQTREPSPVHSPPFWT